LVDKQFLSKIVNYITDFKKENSEFLHFMDKGALLRTDKKVYYLKFDRRFWDLAGKETGKFQGPGFALNTKYYYLVNELNADILHTILPNFVYHYLHDNYETNSFYHTQKFNSERVRVISLNDADDVWNV
jgi:hypothetical protein